MGRLIIDGNRVYELDEACLQRKRRSGWTNTSDKTMQTPKEQSDQLQKRVRK